MPKSATHQRKRTLLRKKLRDQGVPEEEIERRVAIKRDHQERLRRLGHDEEALDSVPLLADVQADTWARLSPDDSKFRPVRPDPLKTGAARAIGTAARVVGRKNAVTDWEYQEIETKETAR